MPTLSHLVRLPMVALALSALVFASTPARAQTPVFTIRSNTEVSQFIQALTVPNARITIHGNVTLDLVGNSNLYIAPGVQIIGDRTLFPRGPLIESSAAAPGSARAIFVVGGEFDTLSDNVRISGIRFNGFGGIEASQKVAISIRGANNVEIDNNEFFGWGRAAVEVLDTEILWRDRLRMANASTIHIHDNFIHDNHAPFGHGIWIREDAYALIDRNVFHNNRHSIASDGSVESGFLAYRNLILDNDGPHRAESQIDVEIAPATGNAGEFMDLRYNTIQHNDGYAFRLHAIAVYRADLTDNVFAVSKSAAIKQDHGSSLREWNNWFNKSPDNSRYCDFDGDGIVDRFMATGATWWYRSTLTGYRWTYLNQSTMKDSWLTLRDVNGDGRCDVSIPGTIYYSGTTPSRGADMLWRKTADRTSPLLWQVAADGNVYSTRTPVAFDSNEEVIASGDFDGDGDGDFLVRTFSTEYVHRILMEDGVGTRDTQTTRPHEWTVYTIGDFDGDGADDVLMQTPEGDPTSPPSTSKLEIWFSGMALRSGWPTWANQNGELSALWKVRAAGDVNGDGKDDIVFHHPHQGMVVWLMNGSRWIGDVHPPEPDQNGIWDVAGAGDFDADGRDDILQRDLRGILALWNPRNATTVFPTYRNEAGRRVESAWSIKSVADFNADGRADILWHHYHLGVVGFWTMNGGTFTGEFYPGNDSGRVWNLEAVAQLEKPKAAVEPGSASPRVPNLWGMTIQEAAQALHALGLGIGRIEETEDCEAEGRISEQSPGQIKVVPGTQVDVWIGKRPAPPRQCF